MRLVSRGLVGGGRGTRLGTNGNPQRPNSLPIFDAPLHYSHDAWERLPPAFAVALLRQAVLQRAMVSEAVPATACTLARAHGALLSAGALQLAWRTEPATPKLTAEQAADLVTFLRSLSR